MSGWIGIQTEKKHLDRYLSNKIQTDRIGNKKCEKKTPEHYSLSAKSYREHLINRELLYRTDEAGSV